MTSYALNEFMKLIFQNKEVIDNVFFFDEVSDCYVQGVEIRLKNYDVKMNYLNLDDHYNRPDPFRKDIKGYVYIILGFESNYQKWLKMMIDGKVAQRICRKYPDIFDGVITPEDRIQMELDKVEFKKEIEANLENR
jgi:hypothetical protein